MVKAKDPKPSGVLTVIQLVRSIDLHRAGHRAHRGTAWQPCGRSHLACLMATPSHIEIVEWRRSERFISSGCAFTPPGYSDCSTAFGQIRFTKHDDQESGVKQPVTGCDWHARQLSVTMTRHSTQISGLSPASGQGLRGPEPPHRLPGDFGHGRGDERATGHQAGGDQPPDLRRGARARGGIGNSLPTGPGGIPAGSG